MTQLPKELRQLINSYLSENELLKFIIDIYLVTTLRNEEWDARKFLVGKINSLLHQHGLKSQILTVHENRKGVYRFVQATEDLASRQLLQSLLDLTRNWVWCPNFMVERSNTILMQRGSDLRVIPIIRDPKLSTHDTDLRLVSIRQQY